MSAYENVKGGKLSFKSGATASDKAISKKKKKKKHQVKESEEAGQEMKQSGEESNELDTGIGHAPDGKKSKKYEELFPVETKRFGYEVPVKTKKEVSREAALVERIKKKADRYCKTLPRYLEFLLSDREEHNKHRSVNQDHSHLDHSGFQFCGGFHYKAAYFDQCFIKDAKVAARILSRSFTSSRKEENEKGKTKKKIKRLAASVEELHILEDPRSVLPQKKTIRRKAWDLIKKIRYALITMATMSREEWKTKLKQIKTRVWLELQHYWVGTKLLWAEICISTRLLVQLSGGKKLTRREQLQLKRTAGDIARLVPFIVIVIVPFMEFLLPVLLKLFPNMLPSTFQDKLKQEAELTKRLEARLQHAKGLQATLLEMADELKFKRGGDFERTAKDLDEFMNKVRTGQVISNREILGFAKLFNDELTLDNISRPRLISMCKYMGLRPYGNDAYLRYALRKKLAWIKSDDRLIRMEGLDSLSESEIRTACRERGMLVSLTPEEMRKQLKNWLDLSLDHSVPSSLLILSRAFVPDKMKPEEAVQATLSSLPDEVVDSVGVTVLPSENTLEERKRKLEFLKQQEELIKQEQRSVKPKSS